MAAARAGDHAAFEQLVAVYRDELHAHCYRMLASLSDADDALQETLVAAWRALPQLRDPAAVRAWLYRIATNCCLRLARKRSPRLLSSDYGPPADPTADLGAPVTESIFLDPWPGPVTASVDRGTPEEAFAAKEGVELAFAAALQHLPATQRAVLVLREVLGFSAAEVADMFDTTPTSVNSALQRARTSVAGRVPDGPRRVDQLSAEQRDVVARFVAAWERADVPAIVEVLAEDVRFTMPPLLAWFAGRPDVVRFLADRVFATPWRLRPIVANGQPALACYQQIDGGFRLGAVNVLSVHDETIDWIAAFVDPTVTARFPVPTEL